MQGHDTSGIRIQQVKHLARKLIINLGFHAMTNLLHDDSVFGAA